MIKLLLVLAFTSCTHFKSPEKADSSFYFNWIKNLDSKYVVGNYPINNLGVDTDGELISVPVSNKLLALKSDTTQKWIIEESSKISNTPVINGGKVIYSLSDGRLIQRDAESGELLGSSELGSGAKAPAYVLGQYAAVSLLNNSISLVDLETNRVLWNYQRANSSKSSLSKVARPLIYNGNVFAGFSDGHIVSLKALTGEISWSSQISIGERFIEIYPYLNRIGQKIVAGTQEAPMAVMDIKSGRILERLPYILNTELIQINENFFFGNNKGHIIKLDKNLKTLEEKRIFPKGLAQLTQFNDRLYGVDFSGKLISFNSSLKSEKEFDLGSSVSTSYGALVESEGQLLLYSSRFRLYSIR